MGIRAETREEVRKETATKIFGQPTANDLTQLEKELIAIAATQSKQASEKETTAMQE